MAPDLSALQKMSDLSIINFLNDFWCQASDIQINTIFIINLIKVQSYFISHRREDSMDVEISASGFTKEMDEDLNDMLLGDQKEGDEEDDEAEDNSGAEEEASQVVLMNLMLQT